MIWNLGLRRKINRNRRLGTTHTSGLFSQLIRLQRRNEITLADLVKKCNNAMLGTTALAIKGLSEPDVKVTRPYASYEGRLSLGDYNIHPETALYIDVKRYFKTKLAKPVGASSFVASAGEIGDTEMADAPAISAVKNSPNYWVMDPNAPGGRLDLTREELGRGYHYGQTVVPINDSEQNVTKLETTQSFDILGFIHADKARLESPFQRRWLMYSSTNDISIWDLPTSPSPSLSMRKPRSHSHL